MNRINRLRFGVLAAVGASVLYGCDSKAPGGDIVARPSTGVQAPAVPPPAPPPPPKPDIDRAKLPLNLRTDAYLYYGLGCTKPLDMEITSSDASTGVLTGSMSTRMTKVDSASAAFEVETTGSLHDKIGDEVVALKPDGVYVVSSDMEKLSKPQLDLPTGFVNGKAWAVDASVVTPQGRVRQFVKSSCKGPKTIKIGGTSYAALYVVGTGTYTGSGMSAHVVMKEWFVKDIGVVKMELVQTPKGKPPVTFDMVWKPATSKAKS